MKSVLQLLVLLVLAYGTACVHPGRRGDHVQIQPQAQEMERLLKTLDRDHDKKITVEDVTGLDQPPVFTLQGREGRVLKVEGVYPLSNLLQELNLAGPDGIIDSQSIFENPVHRISRSIRERYWDNLTRRVDAPHLHEVLPDPKMDAQKGSPPIYHLYVPQSDTRAYSYYLKAARERPELKLKVWRIPGRISTEYMSSIRTRHGLLSLALTETESGDLAGVPFVVPGGRFNEMYGWDSYFESLGLLRDSRLDLARAMVDNLVYEITHYGKILNANRTYYLNRSQPPLLTSLLQAVYDQMEKTPESKAWLRVGMVAAIREYETVWMNRDRLTPIGLSRYYGSGHGVPPEVEPGHFDFVLKPAARRHGLSVEALTRRYNAGQLEDAQLDEFFMHDRAMRESGHDTTYRWSVDGRDQTANFVTVDLNSLLYKYELDIARWLRTEFADPVAAGDWRARAKRRRQAMLKYLWDQERKMFFDYNFKSGRRSTYVSATAFYPFWAEDSGDEGTRFLPSADAHESLSRLLAALEAPGGLLATAQESLLAVQGRTTERQWEYPNGWAPHQMIAWRALGNYKRTSDRDRIVYKWLYMITRNAADYNGTVPEKFDVVRRSHAVFAEYGNVGTRFHYITKEGFGWMNASYQVGLSLLPERLKRDLERLKEHKHEDAKDDGHAKRE